MIIKPNEHDNNKKQCNHPQHENAENLTAVEHRQTRLEIISSRQNAQTNKPSKFPRPYGRGIFWGGQSPPDFVGYFHLRPHGRSITKEE